MAIDFEGRPVRVGSTVRVRDLTKPALAGLSRAERRRARSMIGETFTVEEIDHAGLAWVTKIWNVGVDNFDAHGIGLSASEMELVE